MEARWAVFFDALAIPYGYEVEGFNIDGLYYLPDFWLPESEVWLEIKGRSPDEDEIIKATKLAQQGEYPVVIFWSYFDFKTLARDSIVFTKDVNGVFYSRKHCGIEMLGEKIWIPANVERAFTAARQARFEHGERENGRVRRIHTATRELEQAPSFTYWRAALD